MSVTEMSGVSANPLPVVETGTAEEGSDTGDPQRTDLEAWGAVFDTFLKWGLDLDKLADEGAQPPSARTVALAAKLAGNLRENGVRVPEYVVPDGEGGVAFEWHVNSGTVLLELRPDDTLESSVFENHRIIDQFELNLGQVGA